MSEALREQRPLLCEDLSEEERFPEYPRRYRPLYRGRAKSAAKGATAIITRWPEHWSSTFTYCWVGLGMMALTIFAIYNVMIAFALLPTVHMRSVKSNEISTSSRLPEIFLHFIVNTNEDADVKKYLPYVEIISDKYLDYNFNMILLFNDTVHTTQSAEENNEIALNSLWSKTHFYHQKQKSRKNIKMRHVALSQFMSESPLRTDWRLIPTHFVEFLVKTISIWEKGGIAINPEILTPHSPNVIYIEKLQHILNKYKKQKENVPNEHKTKKYTNKHKDKLKTRVNNIRDVINILEHEENNMDFQENLTEAENVNSPVISHNGRRLLSTNLQTSKNDSKYVSPTIVELPKNSLLSSLNDSENLDHKQHYLANIKSRDETDALEVVNGGFEIFDDINEPKLGLLPLFFEFLFHDKPSIPKQDQQEENILQRHRKSTVHKETKSKNNASAIVSISLNKSKIEDKKYKPMVIPATIIVPDRVIKDTEPKTTKTVCEDLDELTIDLKGNMLATKASCHAFVGTIFNNIFHHHSEETLQDLIIAELSLFCKGLLSSCRGIDVILV